MYEKKSTTEKLIINFQNKKHVNNMRFCKKKSLIFLGKTHYFFFLL